MILSMLIACSDDPVARVDVEDNPLPAFADDCTEGLNDTVDSLSGLLTEDNYLEAGIQLCADEVDLYRIDVPPQTWVSVAMIIDGSGSSSEDGNAEGGAGQGGAGTSILREAGGSGGGR